MMQRQGIAIMTGHKISYWIGATVVLVTMMSCRGCDIRPDLIGVSNTLIDFGLNETAYPLYVWNAHENLPRITIEAEASDPWIEISPQEVESERAREDAYDARPIIVRINRRILDKGEYTGYIELTSQGLRTVTVEVRASMETDGRMATLNIVDPAVAYSRPYLLDFIFALRDSHNDAVIAEPAQFDIAAYEDKEAVQLQDTGLALRTAPRRRMLADIVLDYSLSMQTAFGAITSMEDIARNEILHRLDPEAAVGITVFHREDIPPLVWSALNTDHAYIREQLAAIQEHYVGAYTSGALMFDALMASLAKFEAGNALEETRHIFLFTDGHDRSSQNVIETVINKARSLFVQINVIGIGDNPNLEKLLRLSGRTGGAYFADINERDKIGPHVRKITNNLDGQYRLRWATMSRRDHAFLPEIQIEYAAHRAMYSAPKRYNPTQYAGDILRGVLGTVVEGDSLNYKILINADYIPRFIKELRLYVEATHPFEIDVPDTADGGLLGLWDGTIEAVDDQGMWIDFFSYAEPLPFAGYGPLFAIDFGAVPSNNLPALTKIEVDNDLYQDALRFVVR